MLSLRAISTLSAFACLFSAVAQAEEPLWTAKALTPENAFTAGIEGPNCDAAGNVFAVNYERQGTIGRTTPDGKTEVSVDLPKSDAGKQSVGNGIVFDRAGMMYVADYANHNVLRIDIKTKQVSVLAHDDRFSQPNDLAIAVDGTIYCSDPDWGKSTGKIVRVAPDGKTSIVADKLGTTNGIEVSPDGNTLYVNESIQRGIWSFPIRANGSLGPRLLLKQFDDHGFDGMRCDADGNLYVTRYGKGSVVVLSPKGEVLHEVDVLGESPSNLCFGGPDGRTVYVTEVKHRRLVSFRTERPGLAWQRWQEAKAAANPVRVGVLGLDNYQAVAYAQLFNNPKATGDLVGLKVVAAYPAGSPDIPESVESLPKWEKQIGSFGVEIVNSVDAMLSRVDAVMIMSLDGRTHLEQARAVLKARKPLYIGRPLAASLADAVEIYRLADEYKTPCWSSSQHRFSPGFIGMREHPEVGRVLGCDVYGGCPTEEHHPDLFWHAVHSIDTLYTIMGPGCVSVTCASTPYAEAITGVWSDGRVGTYRGIKQGALKYSATVFGEKGVSTAGVYGHGVPVKGVVPTTDKYMGYEGIAIEMARFFKGGPSPVPAAETIELFAFMEAAHESKRLGGAAVKLETVLTKARGK